MTASSWGTTLKQSIIGILDRLHPKKIVIVSSSPQVRYPDYYGIDMASMDQFIAFKAAIDLLKERDMKDVIARAYNKSKDQVGLPKEQMVKLCERNLRSFSLMRRLRQKWWNFSLRKVRKLKWRLFIRHWKDCMKHVPTIRATGISVGIILLRVE